MTCSTCRCREAVEGKKTCQHCRDLKTEQQRKYRTPEYQAERARLGRKRKPSKWLVLRPGRDPKGHKLMELVARVEALKKLKAGYERPWYMLSY